MLNDKARIAVLVSGGGTNLQALIDAQASGVLKSGEIVFVVSNKPDAYALQRARRAGIETTVITGSRTTFESALISTLDRHEIDVIILAGFMKILSADVVSHYPGRIINVHPALIPSFCGEGFYGLKVHEAALARGVKVTGATVHIVNEIADGGPILLQKAVEVYPDDTPETLQKRVMEKAEWILLPRAAEMLSKQIVLEKEKQYD
ncbi:MAG: phosphoribosylglycinamide formyltransferase [Oscillospiraceae bacterium]|nr:phosphoribosylglycinamide formyltransferase [Oscillospiraceae bacterium]